jgi:hypothetical protein
MLPPESTCLFFVAGGRMCLRYDFGTKRGEGERRESMKREREEEEGLQKRSRGRVV